jgi:hypothetical protein
LVVYGRIESDGKVSGIFFVDEKDTLYQYPVGLELWTFGLDEKIARVKLGVLPLRIPALGGGGGLSGMRKKTLSCCHL